MGEGQNETIKLTCCLGPSKHEDQSNPLHGARALAMEWLDSESRSLSGEVSLLA